MKYFLSNRFEITKYNANFLVPNCSTSSTSNLWILGVFFCAYLVYYLCLQLPVVTVFYTCISTLYAYRVYHPYCYGFMLTYSLQLPYLLSMLPSLLHTATLPCLPSIHYKSLQLCCLVCTAYLVCLCYSQYAMLLYLQLYTSSGLHA